MGTAGAHTTADGAQEIGLFDASGANTPGIIFSGSVWLPTPAYGPGFTNGQWNFVQTWSAQRQWTVGLTNLRSPHFGQPGLDNEYPFGDVWQTGLPWHQYLDSPYQGFGLSQLHALMNDTFKTTMVFTPPGSESKPVPIAQLLWTVQVTASVAPAGGIAVKSASQSPGIGTFDFQQSRQMPTWDFVRTNGERENDPTPPIW